MSEHEWVVECVAQFLRSPLWTTPVHDFIDEHCILFSGTSDAGSGPLGEQSLEHTTIHNRFRELVDNLITEYIEELGVPAEDVLSACEATESEDGAKFLEYMYALDKYETFVLLMARRNAELEAEALRQLNASVSRATVSSTSQPAAQSEGAANVPSKEGGAEGAEQQEEEEEDEDLKAAIAASLKESAGASAHREAELEDEELQRALQLSLAMEDQRKARELELIRLEEEELAKRKAEAEALAATAAAAAAAPAPPVSEAVAEAPAKKVKKTEAQVHEESAKRQEAIKSTVHQARVENAERAVAPPAPAQKPAAAADGPMSPLNTSPSQGGASQNVAPTQQDAPAPIPVPMQTATPAAAKPALPGLGSLRAGRSGATFGGFAKLPSIGGPAPAAPMSFDDLKTQATQAKGEASPASPPAPESEEAIKLRAEHMRRQREKLMALKKQERQNDLEKFRTENGVAPTAPTAASPAKEGTDAQHQDLTRQLARRFRTDIASTAKQ